MKEQIDKELEIIYDKDPNYNEVYEGIFVGNYPFALNKDLLIKNKIEYILNCSKECKCFYENEKMFSYLHLPLLDNMEEDPLKYMEKSNEFIDNALKQKKKILIHCIQGISRSATILYMYLIAKKNYTLNNARFEVKQKRSILCPNIHLQKILKELSIKLHGEE